MFYGSLTIDHALRASAAALPDKSAVVDDGGTLSYRALDRAVDALAAFLIEQGVEPGDRLAYLFWNQREILIAYHAIARVGAVLVSLNTRLTAEELAYQLEQSDVIGLLYDQSFAETMRETTALWREPRFAIVAGRAGGGGSHDFAAVLAQGGAPPAGRTPVDASASSGIWFTSGTTGKPKGAEVRHASSIGAAIAASLALGIGRDCRFLAVAPMFHRGAMEDMHLAVTLNGGTHVMMHQFEPERTLALIEEQAITHAFIVPTMSWMILQNESSAKYDLRSMRHWISASAPFPPHLADGLRERLNIDGDAIENCYGITEMLLLTACPGAELKRKPGSVGRPVPSVRVAIHDETRGLLPAGEVGEIIAAGPPEFRGYVGNEQATRDAILEMGGLRWYRSGDLGYCDEDGYFFIVDRKKDMIITGGENVYSVEVEDAISGHPDVLEVAVVGMPNDKWGETVTAAVVAKPGKALGEDAVRQACAHLADYKRPKAIRIVDTLPRNSFGKIQKPTLKAMLTEADA
jgi:fatty-acyl-CoA synthase